MNMLQGLEILQAAEEGTSPAARKAIDFAGQMARLMGASVIVDCHFETGETFLGRGKSRLEGDAVTWLEGEPGRMLLSTSSTDSSSTSASISATCHVHLQMGPLENEATLVAESGLADLLGDPDRAPLIPGGDFGAGTIGYGLFVALCAVWTKWRRFRAPEAALVDGKGVLSWVNWKAALSGDLGKDIHRQGKRAEWPVVPCADGHVALVYTERDWPQLVELVDDDRLRDPKFETFKGRLNHRDEYMAPLREWAEKVTKAELVELFAEYQVPAAPVMTVSDLLADPLLAHRQGFSVEKRDDGAECRSPVLPHRVVSAAKNTAIDPKTDNASGLPLSGFRVLDLGIITAGAGVSALLADMGAEVLKIESRTYPDPFRAWAGDAVSPFFKGNNRNKLGLALDLKTEEGRRQFESLVRSADVVVENFRRGVLDRLGYAYEALRELNPDIILASVSGSGLTGPGADNSSFGSTLEASSGFAANVFYADEGLPYITGRNVNYPDQTVVMYAAAVIAAALANDHRGMNLDVSQRDVAVFLSGEELECLSAGREVERRSNGHAVQASDGHWVAFPDVADADIGALSAEDAIVMLAEKGIGAAVACPGSAMYRANVSRNNDVFVRSPDGDLVKGFPFQLKHSPMSIHSNSPGVGEHTSLVMTREKEMS